MESVVAGNEDQVLCAKKRWLLNFPGNIKKDMINPDYLKQDKY